ncbi:hypothetical protein MRB53_033181 [Persea americana]|uniref:Uncharacterized protein n=1 Tax=Persea americana TaxID=3435 RepID=A0ACC2KUW0_PERAE|nr:hypothetical protein MRB53_033181 [Persea americana]
MWRSLSSDDLSAATTRRSLCRDTSPTQPQTQSRVKGIAAFTQTFHLQQQAGEGLGAFSYVEVLMPRPRFPHQFGSLESQTGDDLQLRDNFRGIEVTSGRGGVSAERSSRRHCREIAASSLQRDRRRRKWVPEMERDLEMGEGREERLSGEDQLREDDDWA